jgi:hypothetical protein
MIQTRQKKIHDWWTKQQILFDSYTLKLSVQIMIHDVESKTEDVQIADRDYQSESSCDEEMSLYSEFSRDCTSSSTDSHSLEGSKPLVRKKKIINAMKSFVKAFEPILKEKRSDITDSEDDEFSSMTKNDELSQCLSDSSSADISFQSDDSDCEIKISTSIQDKDTASELGGLYSQVNIATAWSDIIDNFMAPKRYKFSDNDSYKETSSSDITISKGSQDDTGSCSQGADVEHAEEIISVWQPFRAETEEVERNTERMSRSGKYKLRNPFKAVLKFYQKSCNTNKVPSHVSEKESEISLHRSEYASAGSSSNELCIKTQNAMNPSLSPKIVVGDTLACKDSVRSNISFLETSLTIERTIHAHRESSKHKKIDSEEMKAAKVVKRNKDQNESYEKPLNAIYRVENIDQKDAYDTNEINAMSGVNQDNILNACKETEMHSRVCENRKSSRKDNHAVVTSEKALVRSGGRAVVISVCQLN